MAASDIRADFVEMARKSALKARVEKYVQFTATRLQDVEPPAVTGLLVTNLPYGDRIGGSDADLRQLSEDGSWRTGPQPLVMASSARSKSPF